MKVFVLSLLLSTAALAGLERRDVPPPPGLPSHPAAVVSRLDSPEVLFHGYTLGDTAFLDVYTATDSAWKRQAHLEVPQDWAEGNFGVTYLDNTKKEGWVLWSESGGVSVLAFPDGWAGEQVRGSCEGGSFSTTGWCTSGVDDSGLFSFYERHEWPGEETDDGRQVEGYTDSWVWSPEKRDFVTESDQ